MQLLIVRVLVTVIKLSFTGVKGRKSSLSTGRRFKVASSLKRSAIVPFLNGWSANLRVFSYIIGLEIM